MIKNKELELAWNFVEKTNRNIFLTGKAGTGKTTFLRKIKEESKKRLVVVAPTGVAAINAKGVTIHSFFQMPFGPILPGDLNNPKATFQQKFNKTKINIIKSLDLLVIDEISMVRADLLDGIDQVLRRYKNRNKVFGGTQVLMIGDLQQLAPIARPSEWGLLKPFYENIYFFSSNAYQKANPIGIELKHIYRQDDEKFISILNEIRNNKLSEQSANSLNERYFPDFEAKENEDYIILTTHNNKADTMNRTAFVKLKSKSKIYSAEIHKKFPEFSYPCLENLALKIGAQVMFTKNDSSIEKRYFNGKIGEVIALEKEEVVVQCTDGEIRVGAETWENVNYSINNETKEIEEKLVGSFTQIPLKLAWAITIHKSQGLTFEKAIIDAEASFAHGQTYVALSRCKTMEGIILKTKIKAQSIVNDGRVTSFNKKIEENTPDDNILTDSEKTYQLYLINDLFDYTHFVYPLKRMIAIFYKNNKNLEDEFIDKTHLILEKIEKLIPVSNQFKAQLNTISLEVKDPESDSNIQIRIQKGVNYFIEYTKTNISKPFSELRFVSDNKQVKKDIQFQLKKIKEDLQIKFFCLKGILGNFSTAKYLALRADAVLQDMKTEKTKDVFVGTTKHQQLFNTLRNYRGEQAKENEIDHFQIFTQRSLFAMSNNLPVSKKQLNNIEGMGKVRIQKYGSDIISIVLSYCKENNIELVKDTDKIEKPRIGSSQDESLKFFKDGKTLEEIAEIRNLAKSTIEGHLSVFVKTGDLKGDDLMELNKYNELKKIMEETEYKGFGDLKNKIAAKFSYGELRIVANVLEYEKSIFNTKNK